MTTWEMLVTIAGLTIVSLVCRAFFLWPEQDLPLPRWLREGLRYAPVAAFTAVVAPDILMSGGHLVDTWRDARLLGAAAGVLWYQWREDLSGTIIVGTGVMLALRHGLGW